MKVTNDPKIKGQYPWGFLGRKTFGKPWILLLINDLLQVIEIYALMNLPWGKVKANTFLHGKKTLIQMVINIRTGVVLDQSSL